MNALASRGHHGGTAVRRVVNDNIAAIAMSRFQDRNGDLVEFLCECGDLRCGDFVEMTVAEYRATVPGWVRAHD